ncbi:fatty acid-binding protein DegV [Bacillus sp. FJAT-27264]|uniref:DegV family protein n=1 Tax=Paenibacillus sp. (strain DSM 101736 / FJAT-27264) TaxID=1850362 RepID=UPI00080815E6|nr:DegV family protein [Bacillus sp. FJAT-27264]OBZ11953.1 fatty acid-binding protein DegV [Bacillus sp. FJAT-27264]
MSTVKIFSDSTSDLQQGWKEKYDVGIVPLYVVFDDGTYKDGVDITPEEVYRKVAAKGSLPKTAAPSPADFMAAFAPVIESGEDIVCISLSSALSSTYQNALLAAGEFPEGRVEVVDSETLCGGIALLVMKAVRAAAKGHSAAEIAELLKTARKHMDTQFVVDTLDYLYMGGRCSGMQNFIGSLLKIRPVLKLIDGSIVPVSKARGKKEKAVEMMLQNALADIKHMDKELLIVAHTLAEEDAQYLKRALEQATGAQEIAVIEAGCVIGSHCGPQTVGLMYLRES